MDEKGNTEHKTGGEGATEVKQADHPKTMPPHPLELSVKKLLHKTRDIEECISVFVPLAHDRHKEAESSAVTRLKNLAELAKDKAVRNSGSLVREVYDAVMNLEKIVLSSTERTLRSALFLNLFSGFEAFIGELLTGLFSKKAELFFKLQSEVSVSDVLRSASLDELKTRILNEYIDDLRRKSYVEQFDCLTKLFDLTTLKAFPAWIDFVEISQRRNLVAHNDGKVNTQYFRMCSKEGVPIDPSLKTGDSLSLSNEYLTKACRVIMEVGFKLVQTLWRKTLPEEIDLADDHLNNEAFNALRLEEWNWAITVGEYAFNLPKLATEKHRLVLIINLAIALKFNGDDVACHQLLKKVDWSAKIAEFRLAVSVLHDDYVEAANWMKKIGKRGQMLGEDEYHGWPLFRNFRGSPEFLEAFESIYGYPFQQEIVKKEWPIAASDKTNQN